jgi:hypothetical protein
LSQNPGTINAITVVFDGVVQTPGDDYTLSGTTLTYVTQPANGTKELIFIGNQSLPAGEPSNGTITVPKLSSSIYASQVEAEAGVENTKLMTPLRVKQSIDELTPPSGLVLLDTKTASASATLNFTSLITSTYDTYMFDLQDVVFSVANVSLLFRTSTDNGTTFNAGATDYYQSGNQNVSGSTSTIAFILNGADHVLLANVIGNAAGYGFNGTLKLFNPLGATLHKFGEFKTAYVSNPGEHASVQGSFRRAAITAVNAVRFLPSSGNITSGVIRMYGIKK